MICLDFACENGHVTEVFTDNTTYSIVCPECGKDAVRQLSAPKTHLEGYSGSFPGAAAKWESDRARRIAKETKTMKDHGSYR